MSHDPRSVAFDRAAEYYDQTRGLSEAGARRNVELLAGELGGRGRVLEIGVGTGQIALPLRGAGVDVVGLDLARPMLTKLVEKSDAASPVPLVQGDATRLPFADGAFGGACFRWVLHLIPDWRRVVEEMVRVVGAGGVVLGMLGSCGGVREQIQECFAEMTGVSLNPPGLTWKGYEQLDAQMAGLGARGRDLPAFTEIDRDDVDTFVRGIEDNAYSWTWAVADDAVRTRAAAEARRWAEDRLGPLDRIPRESFEVTWRAYDLGPST